MLPNRNTFIDDLFNQNDLYTTGSAPTPTPPTPTPPTPTPPTPTVVTSCEDSPFRFKILKDGKKIARDCKWVSNRATKSRCKLDGVKNSCPSTCDTCSLCVDSTLRFQFNFKGKKVTRDCEWVARKNTNSRCKESEMEHTCRSTCGTC